MCGRSWRRRPDSLAREEGELRSWSEKVLGTLAQLWEGVAELGKVWNGWARGASSCGNGGRGWGKKEKRTRVPTGALYRAAP